MNSFTHMSLLTFWKLDATHFPYTAPFGRKCQLLVCVWPKGGWYTSAVHFAVASANFSIGLVLPGMVDGKELDMETCE